MQELNEQNHEMSSSGAAIKAMSAISAKINNEIDDFIRRGGKITVIQPGVTAEKKGIPGGIKVFSNPDGSQSWRYLKDGWYCGNYKSLHCAKIARAEYVKKAGGDL